MSFALSLIVKGVKRCRVLHAKKSAGDFYHVIARGINKEAVFKQKREKNNFLRLLEKHLKDHDIQIYAYVIMSTHFHILIHVDLKILSHFMAIVLAEFAEYYNYKHNRNGHVFQDRFRSECVETEAYFWNCLRYIHMNPVHAKIAKNPMNYQFSSLKEYAAEKNRIIHPDALKLYKSKFGDFEESLEFHDRGQKQVFIDIPEEVEAQLNSAALVYLKQEARRRGLEDYRMILEEKKYREEYKELIRSQLKISKAKTERLYHSVKSCIINK